MHILYVHCSGFLIFKVKEFEEIGHLIQSVRKSYSDIKKFSGLIKLELFHPFLDDNEAFHNWKLIFKENCIPPTMKKFLMKYGVDSIKTLGLEYTNLSEDFRKTFGVEIINHTAIMEIIKGIKFHIFYILKHHRQKCQDKLLLKALCHKIGDGDAVSASLGINVTNHYNIVKDLEKTIHLKTAKLRQLIQPFYPELRLKNHLDDKDLPIFLSTFFNNRITDRWCECEKLLGKDKCAALQKSINATIGRPMSLLDSNLIKECSDELLFDIEKYNSCKNIAYAATRNLAPNLTTLLELSSKSCEENNINLSAAEIIAHAGSLKKLAEQSSTSIHTQNKQNDLLLRINKGDSCHTKIEKKRRSMQIKSLIEKCSLAARVDYFGTFDGNKLFDDTFGRQCFNNHMSKMNTWTNKRATSMSVRNQDEIMQRVKKFKLKRTEKKKAWKKRKDDLQKDILYGKDMTINVED